MLRVFAVRGEAIRVINERDIEGERDARGAVVIDLTLAS